MPNTFNEALEIVITLLRNARNIATTNQKRREAMDVLRSLSLYVSGTNFPCDPEIFEKLRDSIVDKPTIAIIEEFAKVEEDIIIAFNSSGATAIE
jgi:hypothetical protein